MTERRVDGRALCVLIGSPQDEHVAAVANRLGNGRKPGAVITINPMAILQQESLTNAHIKTCLEKGSVPEVLIIEGVKRHIQKAIGDKGLARQYRLFFTGFPASREQAAALVQLIHSYGFGRDNRRHRVRIIHLRSPEVPRGITDSLNLLSSEGWGDKIVEIDATGSSAEVLAVLHKRWLVSY